MSVSEIRDRRSSLKIDPGFRFAHPGYKQTKGGGAPKGASIHVRAARSGVVT
jgi:hypothetical protein